MGASFRANQMSVHAETARDRRDGWTDRQTAFHLYIVDSKCTCPAVQEQLDVLDIKLPHSEPLRLSSLCKTRQPAQTCSSQIHCQNIMHGVVYSKYT